MIKKLLILIGAISLSLGISVSNASSTATSKQNEVKLLYVLHATKGQIAKTKNNQYQLTLKGLKNIAFFSDRPDRVTGNTTISQFINRWAVGDNSFKANNPNAAFVGVLDAAKSKSRNKDHFVILSSPLYNADKNTLYFTIKSIDKNALSANKFKNISLFIDPSICGAWCH
jgi:hypothetical protein